MGNKKVVSSPTYDPKHDSSVSASNSAKSIKNNINNEDDAGYNMKQSSSLVNNCTKSHNISNSHSNIKKVNAIDAKNKESVQSNQTVDNTIYQGIVGPPKMKNISSLFNHDHQKDIFDLSSSLNDNDPKDDTDSSASITNSAKISRIISTMMTMLYIIRNSSSF